MHETDPRPATMRAIRLEAEGGPEALTLRDIDAPQVGGSDALVRVRAAAITRDELEWPVDRLPATPSYELSGTVVAVGDGVDAVAPGQDVFALTSFDRDGVAAELAAVPASLLAPKPRTLDHVESAAIPMTALSAWQAMFVHGRLQRGHRVLVTGAGGGVGHVAVQLARQRGAYVVGTASSASLDVAKSAGADELVGPADVFEPGLEPVDLVVDTVGGDLLARAPELVREGGRIVTIAEEPPDGVEAVYFVVEPDGDQLEEVGRLTDAGELRPAIDSVFPLADARAAFERSMSAGKRGKVVLRVGDDA
jgi:NADPH:quinone reductase-like Zn-dependent oxidoreductase